MDRLTDGSYTQTGTHAKPPVRTIRFRPKRPFKSCSADALEPGGGGGGEAILLPVRRGGRQGGILLD